MSCTTIPFDREVTSVPHAVNADHATSADNASTAASATSATSANYASSAGKAQYIYPKDAFEIDSFNSSKASVSINSDVSANITKAGYTPLGIVGTKGQSGFNSFVNIHNAYFEKTSSQPEAWTAYATLVSDGTTTHADQGIVFYVLYAKNPD